jgi:hypothetical protein
MKKVAWFLSAAMLCALVLAQAQGAEKKGAAKAKAPAPQEALDALNDLGKNEVKIVSPELGFQVCHYALGLNGKVLAITENCTATVGNEEMVPTSEIYSAALPDLMPEVKAAKDEAKNFFVELVCKKKAGSCFSHSNREGYEYGDFTRHLFFYPGDSDAKRAAKAWAQLIKSAGK